MDASTLILGYGYGMIAGVLAALLAVALIPAARRGSPAAPAAPLARLARSAAAEALLGNAVGTVYAAATIIFHLALAGVVVIHLPLLLSLNNLLSLDPAMLLSLFKASRLLAGLTLAAAAAMLAAAAYNAARGMRPRLCGVAGVALAAAAAATGLARNVEEHAAAVLMLLAYTIWVLMRSHAGKGSKTLVNRMLKV